VRLVSSRDWIARTGPRRRRQTTLVFSLTKPALVEFTLVRVAPDCTTVGTFRTKGNAGTNRVRFRGRIGRRALRPGTYRILARTLPAGSPIRIETRLVIFGFRTPSPGEVAAAQAANACSPPPSDAAASGDAFQAIAGAAGSAGEAAKAARKTRSSAQRASRGEPPRRERDVLGTSFNRAGDAVKSLHPLLYVLLGMAIALLGIAALPARMAPNYRMASVLEYQRARIAIAGTLALVVVTVFYVLG
jgi:hypothetical protein